jgi:hypothetical protein
MDNFDLEITYGHMSVEFIMKQIASGNIIIAKEPSVPWDLEKQQTYIESLFFEDQVMHPLVLTSVKQELCVQDGRQRLDAIRKYMNGEFACNDSFYDNLSNYDNTTFLSCMLYCETIMEPTEKQIADVYETLNLRDENMVRIQRFKMIALRDSNLYHPNTVEFAKTKMRDLCPHTEWTSHYIEIGLEDGENVDICDFCGKGL